MLVLGLDYLWRGCWPGGPRAPKTTIAIDAGYIPELDGTAQDVTYFDYRT